MKETLVDKQHTKITLGLVIGMLLGGVYGGIAYGGAMSRLTSLESQTQKQWQKLSKIGTNTTQLAIIGARLETLINLVRDRP